MDEDRRVIEQKLGEYVAAILQGDRGRVVFSIVSESPEKAGDLSRKPCPAPPMRPADSFRPAIVSAYCNNPTAAQDQDRMDIAAVFRGSFPGRFPEIVQNARGFQRNSAAQKKFRGLAPLRPEKPGKTQFSMVQNDPGCTEWRSIKWQAGSK